MGARSGNRTPWDSRLQPFFLVRAIASDLNRHGWWFSMRAALLWVNQETEHGNQCWWTIKSAAITEKHNYSKPQPNEGLVGCWRLKPVLRSLSTDSHYRTIHINSNSNNKKSWEFPFGMSLSQTDSTEVRRQKRSLHVSLSSVLNTHKTGNMSLYNRVNIKSDSSSNFGFKQTIVAYVEPLSDSL